MKNIQLTICNLQGKERADKLLGTMFDGLSRSRIEQLIDEKKVKINGEVVASASHKIKDRDLIEIEIKHEGYLRRQQDMVDRTAKSEHKAIPDWIDFLAIHGLKREAQIKLDRIRPQTLGQAGRISGITPADLSLLAVWIERGTSSREKAD